MATSPFSANSAVQDTYNYARGRARPGERPKGNIYQDRPKENCVYSAVNGAQTNTITFATTNNTDAVAIVIDGASIPFVASTTLTLTAEAGVDALVAAGTTGIFVDVIDIEETDSAVAVLTLVFADNGPHVVTFTGTAGTTAAVATPTAGTASVAARPGTVACYDPSQGDPTICKAAVPAVGATNRPIGIVARGPFSVQVSPLAPWGLSGEEGYPPTVMFPAWQKAEVECLIAGNVTAGDPVYFVLTAGATNGKLVASDGSTAGTSQVTRGDLTFNGTDLVGLDVDALPDLTVASDTSDDITVAALRDAWNASAQHFATAVATIDISGAESYIILTFADTAVHTVAAVSPATADITGLGTPLTAAVAPAAATAQLLPGATFVDTRTLAQGTAIVDLG